jgi:hypothetical protein
MRRSFIGFKKYFKKPLRSGGCDLAIVKKSPLSEEHLNLLLDFK